MSMKNQIADLLNQKVEEFNKPSFIENDPISIPKQFTKKEDIEIAGFISSSLAWGNRKSIIKSSNELIKRMDNEPYDFIKNATDSDLKAIKGFVYRTFQTDDALFFIQSLQHIYREKGGLETVFSTGYMLHESVFSALAYFRNEFLNFDHLTRSEKHIANVQKHSAAKRMNMFLRWMVRFDAKGVDFGLWKTIPMRDLMIPLDVHVTRVAIKLSLLNTNRNNWNSVEILTKELRQLDANDPVKYDFALFGLGIEGF